MYPMQDHSELGMLVRRIDMVNPGNIINFGCSTLLVPVSPEDALVSWMLDLPEGAVVSTAAIHALRHVDRGTDNSAGVQLFCDYLKAAIEVQAVPSRRRNGRARKKRRS